MQWSQPQIVCGKSIIKNSTINQIPHRLYCRYNIPIIKCHSQQYIITLIRTIYFIVVLCVYVTVLYLFYIKRLFKNVFSFHFQTKDAYVYSWSPNDGNRNVQNNTLLGLFLLQHVFKLVNNPIHWYSIFLSIGKFISGRLKQPTKQPSY